MRCLYIACDNEMWRHAVYECTSAFTKLAKLLVNESYLSAVNGAIDRSLRRWKLCTSLSENTIILEQDF